MCGISAIVSVSGSPTDGGPNEAKFRLLHDEMEQSLKLIKHRGPDHNGIWISADQRIVLGHNRLAINDLSPCGNQPLHSLDNHIHAIVNGELYDFEQLKETLEREHGCQFSSSSDSEIVLALYEIYGTDFLQYLRGEFAVCLYDSRKDLFIAARDRYGIKPLFWTQQNGRLLFAAEAKAFLPLGWEPEWDVKSLVEAGWNFDDRTLFTNVKKVRPGYYITVDASGSVEQHRYWDMEFPNKTTRDDRDEEDIIKGVHDRLVEAVKIRLRADVPVGVYLSGGIDSSVLAGLAVHLTKEQGAVMGSLPATDRVSCFCVAFDKVSGFDESDVAERTAQFLGVQMHRQVMDEEAFASRFADATWHCEHHNPDLNFVGKFALSELPRELGFKVVLTGEGSDEIFTGYQIYAPDVLREPDLTWEDAMPEEERIRMFDKAEEETSRYYGSIGADSENSAMSEGRRKLNGITTLASMAAFIPPVFAEWISSLHALNPQDVIANDVTPDVIEKMQHKWHPINTAQYVWTKDHLPNQFMSCLGDRTEMAHSIEGRVPFLDHPFTEYVNGIPPSLKMRWTGPGDKFTGKWVLREAARPYITKELYEREKHPYSAPLAYAVGGPLHTLLSDLITEENIRQLGFVSWEKVSTLLERAFEKQEPLAARLAFVVGQWVVLARRFGVKTAIPP